MSTATINPTAELLDWTNAVYHSDAPRSISHSEKEAFLESPELYHRRYITKEYEPEQSAALDFGSIFHEIGLGVPFVADETCYANYTIANFRPMPPLESEPSYVSHSGSRYWYSRVGVLRESDHWGHVGNCFWHLFGWDGESRAYGYCPWSHFLYSETFIPIPAEVLTKDGKKSGNAWKDFEAKHAGKVLFKPHEFEPIAHMLAAIQNNPAAARLLNDSGPCEQTIRWQDPETGLWCRCRLDKWTGREILTDIKTCTDASPQACANMVARNGYHRQAAWYQEGVEALTSERQPFAFVFVRKSRPHTCAVFDLAEEFLERGRRENAEARRSMAARFQSGNWLANTHGQVSTLQEPRWLQYQSEWEIADVNC